MAYYIHIHLTQTPINPHTKLVFHKVGHFAHEVIHHRRCQVTSVVSDSVRPHRRQPTRLLVSLVFSSQEYWNGLSFPSPKLFTGCSKCRRTDDKAHLCQRRKNTCCSISLGGCPTESVFPTCFGLKRIWKPSGLTDAVQYLPIID